MSWNSWKNNKIMAIGIPLLAACILISLLAGNGAVTGAELFETLTGAGGSRATQIILYQIRMPRTAACLLCGSGLSVAGLLLQEALSNPLASPGIMGINSGAGLFVLLSGICFPHVYTARNAAAFAGALLSALLVFLIARKAGMSKSVIVLSGVAVSSMMTAASNTIITLRPESVSDKIGFSMGSLAGVDLQQLPVPAFLIFIGLAAAFCLGPGIELFAIGDEAAQGLGLAVDRHRKLTVACAALLASAAVCLCGLLGFVGLIVPNILRLSDRLTVRRKILGCIVWGSILVLTCDTLMRTLFYPYELPAGLLLSLIGTPFFILLLMRRGIRGKRHD